MHLITYCFIFFSCIALNQALKCYSVIGFDNVAIGALLHQDPLQSSSTPARFNSPEIVTCSNPDDVCAQVITQHFIILGCTNSCRSIYPGSTKCCNTDYCNGKREEALRQARENLVSLLFGKSKKRTLEFFNDDE